jgi:hypothetical protein
MEDVQPRPQVQGRALSNLLEGKGNEDLTVGEPMCRR